MENEGALFILVMAILGILSPIIFFIGRFIYNYVMVWLFYSITELEYSRWKTALLLTLAWKK